MIPNIAKRGQSFKGVTAYLMHDKEAQTSHRVAWTSTHNLHTDSIARAAKWMAYVDMNRTELYAIKNTGRGSSAGNVYHFSLSWAKDEQPGREHMEAAALSAVERLGLEKHQFYIVAHDDTEHSHLHVVASLVNPETGKIARTSHDRNKLDKWAYEYEQEHGLKCENRAEKYAAWEDGKPAYSGPSEVKQRSRAEYQQAANDAYVNSDSAASFAAALEAGGLTLARGNKRGFVVVDEQGEIYALNRLIEGTKTREISARLKGIDESGLQNADDLAQQRQETKEREDQTNAGRSTRDIADTYHELCKNPLQDLRGWLDTMDGNRRGDDVVFIEPGASAAGDNGLRQVRGGQTEDSPVRPPDIDKIMSRKREEWHYERAQRLEELRLLYELEEQERAYADLIRQMKSGFAFLQFITGERRRMRARKREMLMNIRDARRRVREAMRMFDRQSVKREEETRARIEAARGGAKARTAQEREQIAQEEAIQAKANAILNEAESSPSKAFALQASVSAKTAGQRDKVMRVRSKARLYVHYKKGQDEKPEEERPPVVLVQVFNKPLDGLPQKKEAQPHGLITPESIERPSYEKI